jgi:site-specific DNA-methyltransferase (adenine-specific)
MIKPYYEEPGITIYHGDCVEVMDGMDRPHLIITDPPYGMNFQSNHRAIKHTKIIGDKELDTGTIRLLIGTSQCATYVFCRWDNLKDMPPPKSVLCWIKNNWSMGDLLHEHGRQWEAICFYPSENHKFIKRIPDVINADRTGNFDHPTEKPSGLLRILIEANEGETILDPYMGSGSTLRAAKDAGRKAIGIEIEEKYCEAAVKKLRQEVLF